MPRIDPLKLLVCLSVLLAPNGGIRSANEVKRLANLMAKFSKKLVSKCIYIQILKCTETELLGQFMAAGGWSLVHMWLADGIATKNWPLIQELLELLLCCPVDVERLKSNTAPKLVKTLSKDSSHEGVRLLATKLVEQWLKIARNDIRSGNQQQQQQQQQSSQQSSPAQQSSSSSSDEKSRNAEDSLSEENKDVDESSHEEEILDETGVVENGVDALDTGIESTDADHLDDSLKAETGEDKNDEGEEDVEETKKAFNAAVADSNSKKSPLLFKITMKNGKQVLAKVESPTKKSDATLGDEEEDKPNVEEDGVNDEVKEDELDQTTNEEGVSEVDETCSTEKLNKSVSDNGDKDEKKDKSEVEKEKDKDRRKSVEKGGKDSKDKSSSKDKDKHRDKKSSSSGHRSSSSKSSSSSSSKHNSSTSSNSSKSKSSSSSSSGKTSSSSSKDKDKEKDRNNTSSSSSKHSHKHSSSSKSSSRSSSSSSNDKHREHKDKEKSNHSSKDKEGQSKISSPSSKLDKISKKSREGTDDRSDSSVDNTKSSPAVNKKASISIEVRNSEHRPKTVKTFNSQFRSHGLIEEAPPPPSRKGLKKPSNTTTSAAVGSTATGTVHTKRSSPPPSSKEGPPEKKAREDLAERPGAIKLIPPKRQPSLIESDMFMDALSATLKKDVKKRKRKLSGSEPGKAGDQKVGAAPSTPTTPTTPTPEKSLVAAKATSPEKTILPSPPTSPKREEKVPATPPTAAAAPSSPVPAGPTSPPAKVVAAPMSFYRDTLADSEENVEDKKEQPEKSEEEAQVAAVPESEVESTPEAIPDTPAEPDNNEEDDDVVKKPKRLKSELIEDDDGDDRNNLIDAVGDDVAKKMEAEVPEKKLPGPGCGPNGPPGVLVIHRRKGPKKQLKWKAQEDLEEVRYFELDVTERCNVTRTFTDLKHMERVDERNKYMLARKVDAEDMMVERTAWLPLIAIDNVPPHPEGVNSQERRIQQNRERTILQALYFNRHMIPDSPAEPDVEVYSISEPVHIPMDDVTGNPDSINDFTSMPWPEPKSTPPHESAGFNSPFFPGHGNEFPPFGNTNNWELPGANAGPLPGMFPPSRMGPGIPPMGGNNGPPPGAPPMMRQMNMPPNMPHNMPPNMGQPHPNMFQNNFVRGPHPMQHMNERDDENFRNGPPPPPAWFGGNNREGNNRGPPPHQGNFNNRGGGGGGGRGGGGNWNNNRDHDRGGPRGSNYRPPWLNNNRNNPNNHRGGGRKW